MELLFLWIYNDKNGVFNKQGINFSPEYCFTVNDKEETIELSEDSQWKKRESIFKNETIENVSAIVGKNGSGKSTLINYIYSLNNQTGFWAGGENERYREIYQRIVVFKHNETVLIFHNLKKSFVNKTNYTEITPENFLSAQEKHPGKRLFLFPETLVVLFSNCYRYDWNTPDYTNFDSYENIRETSLFDNNIAGIGSIYFKKMIGINRNYRTGEQSPLYHWKNDYLINVLSFSHFQNLLDVLLYKKLFEENTFKTYSGKKPTRLSVKVLGIDEIYSEVNQVLRYPSASVSEKTKESNDYQNHSILNDWRSNLLNETDSDYITNVLYLNLFFEINMHNWKNAIDTEISNFEDLLHWIKTNQDNFIDEYKAAITEIEQLSVFLSQAISQSKTLIGIDPQSIKECVFHVDENDTLFSSFISYIEQLFSNGNSFILRYIRFNDTGLSGGERAFQNLFARINFIKYIKDISANIIADLPNMLLLIDEIDLYLHPQWQKIFVSLMTDELTKQFPDKKIQVIFSTHSPLLMSDIPRENSVYIRREDNSATCVDSRSNHIQSFGKDIYNLLSDSFYIQDFTMGKFAKEYIDCIIRELLNDDESYRTIANKEEYYSIKNRIELIGNEPVKKRLEYMLKNCEFNSVQLKVNILEEEKMRLEKKIEELKRQ